MKVIYKDSYIHVLPQEQRVRTDLLMGWRQRAHDDWLIIEDNLINRMVLHLPLDVEYSGQNTLKDASGLEDFQVADISKLLRLSNCANFNPMGLGKTVETIRYLQERDARSVLIVCPKIIQEQWQAQLRLWGRFEAEIYKGQRTLQRSNIWIITYDKLRNESTRLKFKTFQWDYVVLDEAHKIKNRKSIQTKAVKDLPSQHRIVLTGTPITRYADDLWSILHFLDTRYSGKSYWNFRSLFCKFKETPWGPQVTGLTDVPERVQILNKLLDVISVRNNAVEVAHGKHQETIRVAMSKKQRELYRKEKQLLLDELPEELTIANGAVLAMRLMQTTSWPGLYIPGESGPKFEWILETCINNPEEKFVVLSTFEKTVTALQSYLNANKVHAVSITGKNSNEDNARSKSCFVNGSAQVLAGTIGAMATGYDGLQHVCRFLIFVDRSWSPEIMKQAEARLHRMGQDSLVNIYYLECQGSFDQHVGRINATKAADIRAALNDEVED